MTGRNFSRCALPARVMGAVLFASVLAVPGSAAAKGPSNKGKTEHKASGAATKHGHKKVTSPPPVAQPRTPKPPAIEAAPVALTEPKVISDHTPAGLTIVATERSEASGMVVALRLPFGSSADPVDEGGLVAVTANAVTRASVKARQSFRDRGGVESVRVEPDAVTFVLSGPASETSDAIDLLAAELDAPIASEIAEAARASLTTTDVSTEAAALREALVYQGYFPYEHRATGSATYLAKVTPASVETLRARRFNVSGATIGVVVPASAASTIAKLKESFAQPAGAASETTTGSLGEQTNQRASDIQEAGARAVLYYGWALPGASAREAETLDVVAHLLGDGGRVADALEKDGIDAHVSAKVDRRTGPSLFTLDVELPQGADVKKAKHAVDDCLGELGKHAPDAPDFMRAKRALSVDLARELDDDVALALHLAHGEPATGEQQALEAVTAEELTKATARFLGPLTRSLVETRDPSAKAPVHASALPPLAPPHAPPTEKPSPKKHSEVKHTGKGHKKS